MNAPIQSTCDVVVIGGGPAGSTAAALIAEKGHNVQLFEREQFPRFHIGESLIPDTYWVLHRLGLIDRLKKSHFIKKYSVQFITDLGKLSEPFYFLNHRDHESSQTWQVLRSEFDQILLDNARDKGAIVHEGVRVLEVLFEGSRAVGVRLQDASGTEREVRCQVVVDASGLSTLLIDRLKLRDWDQQLKKSALWTYFEGAWRGTGQDEGATLVIQIKDKKGWFWYIPLHDNRVSVGVVAGQEYLLKDRASKDPETIFQEEVGRCPGLQPLLTNAKRCAPFRIAKEFSYYTKKGAGDGWVLVGDAFGFLDPLYSSGVLLALVSGAKAAEAIHEGLSRGDTSETQLRSWEKDYRVGMERMRRLVVEFYNGFSFGQFLRKHPEMKGYITDLLVGDIFDPKVDVLWEPMNRFRQEMALS